MRKPAQHQGGWHRHRPDLALEVVAEGREPDHTRVRDVMTTQPHVCHPDDDVEEALNVMEEYQVRRMPVVDVTDRSVALFPFRDKDCKRISGNYVLPGGECRSLLGC
jgi:CBS domain-containing protein